MAEYVRRKRPPASHPYWARLYDRAHPPQVAAPVAVPTIFGLALGLYGGCHPPYSADEAARLAAGVAAGGGVALFVVTVPIFWMDHTRHAQGQSRWAGALLAGAAVGAVLFVIAFVPVFLLLLWYSLCAGRGPWWGMAIGAGVGGAPAALYAIAARRQWQARQRRWPRWERMRARRTGVALSVTQVPAPPTSNPAEPEARGQVGTGA
jgi:hypothetical protein